MRHLLIGTFSSLFAFGLFLFVYGIPNYTPEYLGYGLRSSFLPNLLTCGIMFFSLIEAIKAYRDKENTKPSPIDAKKLIILLKFTFVTLISVPLMELITFIPAAILIITAYQWLVGQRNIKTLAIVSVSLTLVVYYLTTEVLLIHLP